MEPVKSLCEVWIAVDLDDQVDSQNEHCERELAVLEVLLCQSRQHDQEYLLKEYDKLPVEVGASHHVIRDAHKDSFSGNWLIENCKEAISHSLTPCLIARTTLSSVKCAFILNGVVIVLELSA